MVSSADPATTTQRKFLRFASFAVLSALAFCSSRATAQSKTRAVRQPTRRIVVSIPDRKLAFLENDQVVKTYDVAVGAPVSPSPDGEYQIAQRLENPTYYQPGIIIGPGPANPLGPRWIGLDVKGLGIHGTNRPDSIGQNASHGCIRLRNRDIQDLFARVKVGDRVSFIAERSDEVARLFGLPPDQGQVQQTVIAKNENVASQDVDAQGQR